MRFSGKTVIVTGAASGIGAAATALFASEGAIVFAADIDVDEAKIREMLDEKTVEARRQFIEATE